MPGLQVRLVANDQRFQGWVVHGVVPQLRKAPRSSRGLSVISPAFRTALSNIDAKAPDGETLKEIVGICLVDLVEALVAIPGLLSELRAQTLLPKRDNVSFSLKKQPNHPVIPLITPTSPSPFYFYVFFVRLYALGRSACRRDLVPGWIPSRSSPQWCPSLGSRHRPRSFDGYSSSAPG